MATKTEIQDYIDQALPDNTNGEISEGDVRNALKALTDWTTDYNPAWDYRGAWVAGQFLLNDVVTLNGSTYRCKVAHTNQSPTNTVYWDIVAAKGDSGDQIQNFGGSLVKNGALELGTLDNWTGSTNTIVEDSDGIAIRVGTDVGINLIQVRFIKNRLYCISADVKSDQSVLLSLQLFQKNGEVFLKNFGSGSSTAGLPTGVLANYETKKFFYGGPSETGSTSFGSAYSFRLFLERQNGVTETFLKNVILQVVALSEPVPSNLEWYPDGQALFDPANPLRKGTYINSTVGIFWHTQQEIPLQPNGTSISFNIRRTYKFTWAVLYNDAVTIVSQPSATVNANTDALLVLTGTAGKSLTISIQQIQ
jgi:hypothetical protein